EDRPLQHFDAGRAEDGQSHLGSDSVDLDQLLEELQLRCGAEAKQSQLVLPDVRVDVQLDLAANRTHALAGSRRDTDQVADTPGLSHDLLAGRAHHLPTQVADHGAESCCRSRRLRTWHRAMARASAAWSSSPVSVLTWRASMRAICALSAMP